MRIKFSFSSLSAGLLVAVLLLHPVGLMADDNGSNHSVGVHIGFAEPIFRLNAPSFINENRTQLDKTVLNGMKVGVVYDATVIKGFGLSMGLNYTFGFHQTAWTDYGYNDNGMPVTGFLPKYEYRTSYSYHQAEVFVDWQYKFEIAKTTYLILYSGPTIQCALAMKSTDEYRLSGSGVKESPLKPVTSYVGETGSHIRRLNITWGVGAGFQYKRYYLRGGYDFGLMNPYNQASFSAYGYAGDDADRLTRGRLDQWQVKIGWYFLQR